MKGINPILKEIMMTTVQKPYKMIEDFITGEQVPEVGPEENRQAVERFLVEKKGYDKADIEVDAGITVMFKGTPYDSSVNLVVSVEGTRFMAIKCPAGSLESWEREILAAARLMEKAYQIPFALVADGTDAVLLDTLSGKRIADGMDAIFSKENAKERLKKIELKPLPDKLLTREQIIFRSYDLDNVNIKRNIVSACNS